MNIPVGPPFATLTDKTGTHIVGGHLDFGEPMLIRDSVWEKIREQFSDAEKLQLREVVTGEAICPKGVLIDPDRLEPELKRKLSEAVRKGVAS
jgi:hypothetical protein